MLDILLPTVTKLPSYVHSETNFKTLLRPYDHAYRTERVKKILAITEEGETITQLGGPFVRLKRTPDIKFDDISIGDLISRSEDVS